MRRATKKNERGEKVKYEYANGYKVTRIVGFDNGSGFAFGVDGNARFPLMTCRFTERDGKKTFYGGRFFGHEKADAAKRDFTGRVEKYKAGNPDAAVKYNYLANAEMGAEGNYNMIDGIINNAQKPSMLEQMAEYERGIANVPAGEPANRKPVEVAR